jgi:phosphatidylglycerophosphatase A
MSRVSLPVWIASLGGLGRSPWAPATVATFFVGIPSACLLYSVQSPLVFLSLVPIFFLSCYTAARTEIELQKHDPSEVVIDELMGFLVTMAGLPIGIKSITLGFIAFRLFDIWKPWPICLLHRKLNGGLAIVIDDVAAGVYANITVWVILKFWP